MGAKLGVIQTSKNAMDASAATHNGAGTTTSPLVTVSEQLHFLTWEQFDGTREGFKRVQEQSTLDGQNLSAHFLHDGRLCKPW